MHVDISLESAVQPCSRAFFTAVLDGHAGVETVNHLAETLLPALLAHGRTGNRLRTDTLATLRATILGCEADVLSRDFTSGSTLLAAIMIDDKLFVANVGDCRAVVCEKKEPLDPSSSSNSGRTADGSIEGTALAAAAAAVAMHLRTSSECGSSCSGFGSGSGAQTPVRAESSGGDFMSIGGGLVWGQQHHQQREDTTAPSSPPTELRASSPSSPSAALQSVSAFSTHPSAVITLSAFAAMRQSIQTASQLKPRLFIPDSSGAFPSTPSTPSPQRDSSTQRPCRAGVSTLVTEGLQVRQLTNDHAIKGNILEKARVQAMGVSVSGDGYVHLTVNGECNDSGVTRVLGRAHIKRAASNPSIAHLYRRSQIQSLAGITVTHELLDAEALEHQNGHHSHLPAEALSVIYPRLLAGLSQHPTPTLDSTAQASLSASLSAPCAPQVGLVEASQLLKAAGLMHTSRLMELCSKIPSLRGINTSSHTNPGGEGENGNGSSSPQPTCNPCFGSSSHQTSPPQPSPPCDTSHQQQVADAQQQTASDERFGCCVLIPDPELHTYTITRESEFLVLACDGIWDVMTNGEVVRTVRRVIARGGTASEAAACLAQRAVAAPESRDNCSVVVLCFSSRQLLSHSTRNSALRRGPSSIVSASKLDMKSVAE